MTTTITERLARYRELNTKRTQGEWQAGCHPARQDLSVVRPIMFHGRVGIFPECEGGAAYFKHVPDGEFIASAPAMFTDLEALHGALRKALGALHASNYLGYHDKVIAHINEVLGEK